MTVLSEREALARQRSAEVIASAEALLAEPRDPAVVEAAAAWMRESERRQAEERAAVSAENVGAKLSATSPRSSAPAPAAKPVAYVTRAAFREYQNGIEAAVARFVKKTEVGLLVRAAWRVAEAERRIAELEARLAKLEGRSHGDG